MNIYDRIFKENIEPLIPFLFQKVLGLYDAQHTEELKDKLHATIEQETDYIRKVLHTEKWKDYILHIEFQVADETEMVNRMLVYFALLHQKHKLDVKQFVIYLGKRRPPKMPTAIARQKLLYNFTLIDIQDIGYDIFLQSDVPEEIILAILGNNNGKTAETVITEVLEKLNTLSLNGVKVDKHIVQLKIISNLRNLQPLTYKLIKKMPFKYDLESDVAFIEGREIGEARGEARGEERGKTEGFSLASRQIVAQMLRKQKYSIEEIVENTYVSLETVLEIQEALEKGTFTV
jgi:predicted transposase YdaD